MFRSLLSPPMARDSCVALEKKISQICQWKTSSLSCPKNTQSLHLPFTVSTFLKVVQPELTSPPQKKIELSCHSFMRQPVKGLKSAKRVTCSVQRASMRNSRTFLYCIHTHTQTHTVVCCCDKRRHSENYSWDPFRIQQPTLEINNNLLVTFFFFSFFFNPVHSSLLRGKLQEEEKTGWQKCLCLCVRARMCVALESWLKPCAVTIASKWWKPGCARVADSVCECVCTWVCPTLSAYWLLIIILPSREPEPLPPQPVTGVAIDWWAANFCQR